MSITPAYRSPVRRRPSYGLDPLGFFSSLTPTNFMEMLNRSNDIGISVSDGAITYDINLAGFEQSEISVKVDPKTNMLNIEASRSGDNGSVHKRQAIYLGEDKVAAENLRSSYRNGMLTIVVTKPELTAGDAFEVPIESIEAGDVSSGEISDADLAEAQMSNAESSGAA